MTKSIVVDITHNPTQAYGEPEKKQYSAFELLQPLDDAKKIAFGHARLPQSYSVRNARVLGLSNVILNSQNMACLNNIVFNPKISDKVFDKGETGLEIINAKIHFSPKNKVRLKKAIFLGSHPNFGHWVFNHLARLKYVTFDDPETKYIIHSTATANQIAFLNLCGIPSSKLHLTEACTITEVDHLLIPQMPWHLLPGEGVWWSPSSIQHLRTLLFGGNNLKPKNNRRIFLTRQHTNWRRVINEAKLFQMAKNYGFELIDVGKLAIKEQFDLGLETSSVISPLGANSNFFLFMQNNTKLLELAPPMNCMNVTGRFCQAAAIHYHQLFGNPSKSKTNNEIDADYYINEQLFEIELQRLLQREETKVFALA